MAFYKAERVAVGHTTDDYVETILLHLIRGSGTRGLRGLQPTSRWQSAGVSLTVIRPLLEISREETNTYCSDHQLAPRTDTSNMLLEPLRNKIRHQLLPLLRNYNPQVTEAHEVRVVVVPKREGVPAVQPAQVAKTAVFTTPDFQHLSLPTADVSQVCDLGCTTMGRQYVSGMRLCRAFSDNPGTTYGPTSEHSGV